MKVKTKENVHQLDIEGLEHPGLRENKVYDVIGLDDENFRVIDEKGEPILYPKYLFVVIDDFVPSRWIKREYSDGEYFIDPPELSKRGFYEDYFDHKEYAIKLFEAVLRDHEKAQQKDKK